MGVAGARKYTYADYLSFPDDGNRYEIIGGDLFVSPTPVTKHQSVVAELLFVLIGYAKKHDAGVVLPAPTGVKLSNSDIVEPDILFVAKSRKSIIDKRGLNAAPDLVVEVLSPGTRKVDEERKRKLYDSFGVAEYWMADPDADSISVLRREGGKLVSVETLTAKNNDVLQSPLFPSLKILVAEIFAE